MDHQPDFLSDFLSSDCILTGLRSSDGLNGLRSSDGLNGLRSSDGLDGLTPAVTGPQVPEERSGPDAAVEVRQSAQQCQTGNGGRGQKAECS